MRFGSAVMVGSELAWRDEASFGVSVKERLGSARHGEAWKVAV